MDSALVIASVALGTSALDTMFVTWLRSMGIVTQQKWIALLALVFAIVVQVVYTVATGVAPITAATYAAAVLVGINSGFAAGGLHDHATAAAAAMAGTRDGGAAPSGSGLTVEQVVENNRRIVLGELPVATEGEKRNAGLSALTLMQHGYSDMTEETWRAKYPAAAAMVPPGFLVA